MSHSLSLFVAPLDADTQHSSLSSSTVETSTSLPASLASTPRGSRQPPPLPTTRPISANTNRNTDLSLSSSLTTDPPQHIRRPSIPPPPLPEWFIRSKNAPVVTQPVVRPTHKARRCSASAVLPHGYGITHHHPHSTPIVSFTETAANDTQAFISVTATSRHKQQTQKLTDRELMDALRLLCSGRVFTLYTSTAADATLHKQECYLFFDLIDSVTEQTNTTTTTATQREEKEEKTDGATESNAGLEEPGTQTADKDDDDDADEQDDEDDDSPSSRHVDQGGVLYWTPLLPSACPPPASPHIHPHKHKLPDQSISLIDIDSILLGKHTSVFQHPGCALLRDDCCFSLIPITAYRHLYDPPRSSIDLVSKSPIMLVSFLQALKRMIAANNQWEGTSSGSRGVMSIRQIMERGVKEGILMGLIPSYRISSSQEEPTNGITTATAATITPSTTTVPPTGTPTPIPLLAAPVAASSSTSALPPKPLTIVTTSSDTHHSAPATRISSASVFTPKSASSAAAAASASSSSSLLTPATSPRQTLTVATHLRSRSQQHMSSLFHHLADLSLSYPATITTIRSLSPLPIDKETRSPGRRVTVITPPATSTNSKSSTAHHPDKDSNMAANSASSSTTATTAASTPSLQSLLTPGDPTQHFTLLTRLGAGHASIVYKAVQHATQSFVAIKTVELNIVDNTHTALATEIASLAQCASDFFVQYLGSYHHVNTNTIWIITEYMDGGSLSDFMAITGHTLLEVEIAAVMKMCLLALEVFHRQGRIHRDIKAANVLFASTGEAKLCDVGVAATLTASAPQRHTTIGSPYWIAPEMLSDGDYNEYSEKVDIWSLGITCIELAQGAPPHHHLPPFKVLSLIPDSPAPTLESRDHGGPWSNSFTHFLTQCLQKDPTLRASALSLLQHPFISRIEVEEAVCIVSAMWTAWQDKVDTYRQIEAEMKPQQHTTNVNHPAGSRSTSNAIAMTPQRQHTYLHTPPSSAGALPVLHSSLSPSSPGSALITYPATADWHAEYSVSSRSLNTQHGSVNSVSPQSSPSSPSISSNQSSSSTTSTIYHVQNTTLQPDGGRNTAAPTTPMTHQGPAQLPSSSSSSSSCSSSIIRFPARRRSLSLSQSLSTYGHGRTSKEEDHADDEDEDDEPQYNAQDIEMDEVHSANSDSRSSSSGHSHSHQHHDTPVKHIDSFSSLSHSHSHSHRGNTQTSGSNAVNAPSSTPSQQSHQHVKVDGGEHESESDEDHLNTGGFRSIAYTAELSTARFRPYANEQQQEGEITREESSVNEVINYS